MIHNTSHLLRSPTRSQHISWSSTSSHTIKIHTRCNTYKPLYPKTHTNNCLIPNQNTRNNGSLNTSICIHTTNNHLSFRYHKITLINIKKKKINEKIPPISPRRSKTLTNYRRLRSTISDMRKYSIFPLLT